MLELIQREHITLRGKPVLCFTIMIFEGEKAEDLEERSVEVALKVDNQNPKNPEYRGRWCLKKN